MAEIAAGSRSKRDVLACALALSAAGMIRPVRPDAASVTALNGALSELGESVAARPYVAMSFGTAIGLEPELWRHLWHRGALPERPGRGPTFSPGTSPEGRSAADALQQDGLGRRYSSAGAVHELEFYLAVRACARIVRCMH